MRILQGLREISVAVGTRFWKGRKFVQSSACATLSSQSSRIDIMVVERRPRHQGMNNGNKNSGAGADPGQGDENTAQQAADYRDTQTWSTSKHLTYR